MCPSLAWQAIWTKESCANRELSGEQRLCTWTSAQCTIYKKNKKIRKQSLTCDFQTLFYLRYIDHVDKAQEVKVFQELLWNYKSICRTIHHALLNRISNDQADCIIKSLTDNVIKHGHIRRGITTRRSYFSNAFLLGIKIETSLHDFFKFWVLDEIEDDVDEAHLLIKDGFLE